MSLPMAFRRLFAPAGADGPPEFEPGLFVHVRLPLPLDAGERALCFEDPLQYALEAADLGAISGSGLRRGEGPGEHGCGIDIDVCDLDAALSLLRSELVRLGIPAGSELEYTRDDERLRDRLTDDGWRIGLPRTRLHPGFGV